MDRESRETIEYLRAQPRGGVIRWSSHHVTEVRPWATHWVDVHVPSGGPPGMSLVWTILAPEDARRSPPEMLWQFPWSYDLDVHSVWDPFEGWYAKELAVPAGESLPADVVAAFRRLASRVEADYRERGPAGTKPVARALYVDVVRQTGSAYTVRGGWSVQAVCDSLSHWARRHASRSDLRFEWDG